MGKFRDRMDEELRIRGYAANTRLCYLRAVRHFVGHFMRPPDQLPSNTSAATNFT